jgi:hypothetical protein
VETVLEVVETAVLEMVAMVAPFCCVWLAQK